METNKRIWQVVMMLGFIVIMSTSGIALALAAAPGNSPELQSGRDIGLASSAIDCLGVGVDGNTPASGTVTLRWGGQVERARLIVSVAGAEAAHTIKVNGQPVAQAPIYPDGQPCSRGEIYYLDISPDAVIQGANEIEITNDGLINDSWTVSSVRLEVLGDLAVVDTVQPTGTKPTTPPAIGDLSFPQVFSYTLVFTSSFDSSTQEFRAQVPVADINDCDTIAPAPLVIYGHGRSQSMFEPFLLTFDTAAQNNGWLLASPELHGSWPGSGSFPIPNPPGKYAYASLEAQYDIVDTVKAMIDLCNVKLDQIYFYGNSMGAQTGTVAVAKWPHLFAAIFDNKGPTDMASWYDPNNEGAGGGFHRDWMERECHIGGVAKTPAQNPICYQRRSSLYFASNYVHLPISITHSVADQLVEIYHSRNLRDAINSYSPDQPASVYEDTIVGPTCTDGGRFHCYIPDPQDVIDFLGTHTLNNNHNHINITTDESKTYYWLDIEQVSGGERFTEVEATYNPLTKSITAIISDTGQLRLSFNLGSTQQATDIIPLPSLGLPENLNYLIEETGQTDVQQFYSSGYFDVDLNNTGQYTLTITPELIGANPELVYLPVINKN